MLFATLSSLCAYNTELEAVSCEAEMSMTDDCYDQNGDLIITNFETNFERQPYLQNLLSFEEGTAQVVIKWRIGLAQEDAVNTIDELDQESICYDVPFIHATGYYANTDYITTYEENDNFKEDVTDLPDLLDGNSQYLDYQICLWEVIDPTISDEINLDSEMCHIASSNGNLTRTNKTYCKLFTYKMYDNEEDDLHKTRKYPVAFPGMDFTFKSDQVLTSNTTYKYIVSCDASSPTVTGYFTTPPNPGTAFSNDDPLKIWVQGDAGSANGDQGKMKEAFLKYTQNWENFTNDTEGSQHFNGTDLILSLGDNAYGGSVPTDVDEGADYSFQEALFDPFEKILKYIPYFPALGNHETAYGQIQDYYDIFDLPVYNGTIDVTDNGEVVSNDLETEEFYSFDYGNVHFISLNSQAENDFQIEHMKVWLENDLCTNANNSDTKWTIVYAHAPIFTSGPRENRSTWNLALDGDKAEGYIETMAIDMMQILQDYDVDLVLSGHNHMFERSYFLEHLEGVTDSDNTNDVSVNNNTNEVTDLYNKVKVLDNDDDYNKTGTSNNGTVFITCGSSCKHERIYDSDHTQSSDAACNEVIFKTYNTKFFDHPVMKQFYDEQCGVSDEDEDIDVINGNRALIDIGSLSIEITEDLLTGKYIGFDDNGNFVELDEFTINKPSSSSASIITSITANLKVYLEGAWAAPSSEGLMSTSLYDAGLLPLSQPYNVAPYNYDGNESVTEMPDNVVDWVLVEIGEGEIVEIDNSAKFQLNAPEQKAALLLSNGNIINPSTSEPLIFDNLYSNTEYHIAIRHRNHLDIVSNEPYIYHPCNPSINIDFTTSSEITAGLFQIKLIEDIDAYAMYVGDYTQDGIIQVSDHDAWKDNPAQLNGYYITDGTLDGIVQLTDDDVWRPNKAKIGYLTSPDE